VPAVATSRPAALSRPPGRPSIGPALIVVGVAVFVVLGGIVLSFATGGWGGPGSAAGPTGLTGPGVVHVKGSPLGGVSAEHALSIVAAEGEPPADVADTLVVPAGASVTGHEDNDGGFAGPFDRSVFLAVDATPAQVVAFYKAEMPHRGWGPLPGGDTTAGGSRELFYEIASTDGYYWQVVVTITSVEPTLTPALGGGDQTAPTSRVVLELMQVQDAD
jgi:hypothetical protein